MRTALLILLSVAACGGQAIGQNTGDSTPATDPSPNVDDPNDGGSSTLVTDPPAACVESPQPSLGGTPAIVNFDVTNTTAEVRYVVTQGVKYAPIELTTNQGGAFSLVVNDPVICEGPAPRDPYASRLVRIEPGATVTIPWSAQVASAGYTVCVDCAKQGWPAMGVQKVTKQMLVPAPPGDYTAKLKVIKKLSYECHQDPNSPNVDCTAGLPYEGTTAGLVITLSNAASFTLAYPAVHVAVSL